MKRIMKIGVAAIVFTCLCMLSAAPNAQAQSAQASCSNRTLKGSYGFYWTGTRIDGNNPGPRAGAGRFTADGEGGLSASATKSKNGTIIQNVTLTGTYTVNSDCTGSFTGTESDEGTRNFDFVIVDHHTQVFGIETQDGRAVTFVAKRQ